MNCFKIFLFTCFFLAPIATVNGAEQFRGEEVWEKLSLKVTQAQQQLKELGVKEQLNPVQMDKFQRRQEVDQAFLEIERRIFTKESQLVLPEALKELHRRQSNLDTSFGFIILSPLRDILYSGIRRGQEKGIPSPWVVFAHLTASEFFCINYASGEVARYTVVPKVKIHDRYSDLYEWLAKIVLKN
ncbi:MAG: SMI1/KNR4 family protein [Alphaproteobacteria bacterium]|jgi:hypothetical protein|nr:SMI1/KNR4 family protein [Alphaproteobacteria bacterium]